MGLGEPCVIHLVHCVGCPVRDSLQGDGLIMLQPELGLAVFDIHAAVLACKGRCQLQCEQERLILLVRCDTAYYFLADGQFGRLPGVGHQCGCRLSILDRSGLAAVGYFEDLCVFPFKCFGYGVAHTLRQALDDRYVAVLQGQLRYAVFEGRRTVGSGNRRISKSYSYFKVFTVVSRDRRDDLLAYHQAAFTLRVRECCRAGSGRPDRSRLTCACGYKVVLVRLGLSHTVGYSCGQAFDGLTRIVLQCDLLGDALRELHAAVSLLPFVNTCKGNHEVEFLIAVSCVAAHNRLLNRQFACLAGVGEGHRRIFVQGSRLHRRIRGQVHCVSLGDLIGHAFRQALDRLAGCTSNLHSCSTIREGYIAECAIDRLAQLDREDVGCGSVCRHFTHQFLLDRQVSCLAGVGECYGIFRILRINHRILSSI